MELLTKRDLKKYIMDRYPQMLPSKILIYKQGTYMHLVMVKLDGTLADEPIFNGSLETVNSLAPMKKMLDAKIAKALDKHGFIPK